MATETGLPSPEEMLKMCEQQGFNEMVGYAKHICDRNGTEAAVAALKSILLLASETEIHHGYDQNLFAAAHSHWRAWNLANPQPAPVS